MAKVFLNMRSSQGRETVDEYEPEPGQSNKEFRKYVNDMVSEYHLCNMPVYKSSRPCANWK